MGPMRVVLQRFRSTQFLIAAFLAVCVASTVFACSQKETPTNPLTDVAALEAPSAIAAKASSAITAGAASLSPELQARIAVAQQRTAWVGALHAKAMADLMGHRSTWVGNEADRVARICGAVTRVTLKYAREVEAATGVPLTSEQRLANVRAAVAHTEQCASRAPMSVFGRSSLILRAPMLQSGSDTLVSGAFAPFADSLSAAVQASDGTVAGVAAAVSRVVALSNGLPDADLNIIVASGQLDNSSAVQWNDYADSGGFDGGGGSGGGPPVDPYAIFVLGDHRVRGIVGADAIGCAAGALSSLVAAAGGPIGWGAIAAQCAIWGIAGSAGAALAY